jgi:transposase InsO family protein
VLYPPFFASASSISSSKIRDFGVLHARHGLASAAIVRKTFNCHHFVSSNSSLSQACVVSKIHKLPFSPFAYQASGTVDLICLDVWGPALVNSTNGFRYYVLFFDHFSKYTWIYFLKNKSNVFDVFHHFPLLVEKFFGCPIKQFQADWGGEFQALNSYLRSHGITQRVSCPNTSEQNGCAKRKHYHITETSRTFLHHALVPSRF